MPFLDGTRRLGVLRAGAAEDATDLLHPLSRFRLSAAGRTGLPHHQVRLENRAAWHVVSPGQDG